MSDFPNITPPTPIRPRPLRAVVPHTEVASVLATARGSNASPSPRLALEFLVLTASRTGEVLDARWDDIDLESGEWRVSQWEHKRTAPYRPLSSHAHRVLNMARELSAGDGLVFPGRSNRALSSDSLSALLRALGTDVTPQSFRVSFSQWCADTGVSHRYISLSLGHVVPAVGFCRLSPPQPVHEIMQGWGDYLTAAPAAR